MNDEQFKKTDEKMMNQMKPVRERRVSPAFLNGFAASVIRKIKSGKQSSPAKSFGWYAAVPVFAVLLLAVVTVFRAGSPAGSIVPAHGPVAFEIAQLPKSVERMETSLAEEIEALQELGAWTDDDEKAAGVVGEEEEFEEVLG